MGSLGILIFLKKIVWVCELMGVGRKKSWGEGVRRSGGKGGDDVFLSCCPARPVSSDGDWRLLPRFGG